jgi:hypothetical protein
MSEGVYKHQATVPSGNNSDQRLKIGHFYDGKIN